MNPIRKSATSMSEVTENWTKRRLQYVRGLPFVNAPRYSKVKIEAAIDYVARDGDIVITSYPKTGTYWLGYIIGQIISNGEFFPNMNEMTQKEVPLIEMTGISAIEEKKRQRIYRQHLPFNMMKKNDKAKYLYIYRKPEDTVVSYYYYLQELFYEEIPLDEFFEDFLAENVPYGSYFKHVSSFVSRKEDGNLFITTYEKLTVDRRNEILRIAKFLGDEYHRCVGGDESVLNAIMEHTSFDYMKTKLWYDNPDFDANKSSKGKASRVNHFRKGVIGDGLRVLSSDQIKRLRDLMEQQIEDKHVIDEWQK